MNNQFIESRPKF